jgi:hypothetical protein
LVQIPERGHDAAATPLAEAKVGDIEITEERVRWGRAGGGRLVALEVGRAQLERAEEPGAIDLRERSLLDALDEEA